MFNFNLLFRLKGDFDLGDGVAILLQVDIVLGVRAEVERSGSG